MSFIRKIKKDGAIYLAEVENVWVDGTCRQRHLRYIGKEVDEKTILSASISNVEIEDVKIHGPLLVLNHIASEIGLSRFLGEYGEEILSMVYAHCLDYKSLKKMEQWFEGTDLNRMLSLECLTEKRLLNALDSLEQKDSQRLQKELFEAVKKKYRLKTSGVLYDVTNTYLYGKQCPLGKLGHDKEGVKGRPLIQVGLGVTKAEGIPMFHKVFDGNIHDAKTLQDLITSFRQYRVHSGLIIYDRGIMSAQNVRDIKELNWNTLCGLPLHGKLKEFLRSLIAQKEFIQIENRIRLNKTIFYVVSAPYEIGGISGIIAVCFNEQHRKDLRESRYDEILNAQQLLSKGKTIKPGLTKCFNKDGSLIKKKLQEAEEFDGFSCIFSTQKGFSKQQMVRLYFNKDLVEKAFRTLKGITRLQPIRMWLYNRVTAHVFLCYLAYLLLSLLQYQLRKINMSAEEALTELATMYKVYLKDPKKGFRIGRTVTLTKKQEVILRTISPCLLKS
jgi:transposase